MIRAACLRIRSVRGSERKIACGAALDFILPVQGYRPAHLTREEAEDV
jgi:hypothetical protein